LKILEKDLKHGKLAVFPENLDDLWVLYNILKKNDLVYSRTRREIKASGDEVGSSKSRRISINLGLRVEDVYFDKSVNRLRIHGIIIDCPEEFEIKGSYHTINAIPGDNSITIVKERWYSHELQRMEAATEPRTLPVILVALDEEECGVAVIHRRGIEVKAELRAKLPGKMEEKGREESRSDFYKNISDLIQEIHKDAYGTIVIVGPGFAKENLFKYIRDKKRELASHIVSLSGVGNAGVGGIKEAVRTGILSNVLKKLKVSEEVSLVEELLARLATGKNNFAYGLEEVEKASSMGAVEKLLVADVFLREAESEERTRRERLIEEVERMRGKVFIISTEHEGGEKLLSLSGIAALLRFSVSQIG
jgi:protein pelota